MALELEKGSVQNAVYADTENPHHNVRVVEGAAPGGGDLLIVAGEEHDQGITPESYQDVYIKYDIVYFMSSLSGHYLLLIQSVFLHGSDIREHSACFVVSSALLSFQIRCDCAV